MVAMTAVAAAVAGVTSVIAVVTVAVVILGRVDLHWQCLRWRWRCDNSDNGGMVLVDCDSGDGCAFLSTLLPTRLAISPPPPPSVHSPPCCEWCLPAVAEDSRAR